MRRQYFVLLLLFAASISFAKSVKKPANWYFSAGMMQLLLPQYQGADKYRWLVVPTIDIKYKKRFFVNVYNGIGVNLLQTQHFTAGTNLRYNYGGNNNRSQSFPGLTDTHNRFQAGIFLSYRVALFNVDLKSYQALDGMPNARYYSPDVSVFIPFNKKFITRFSISARYNNKQFMQSLFSVNAQEAQASGLKEYKANAGWQSVSYTFMPIYRITSRWSLTQVLSIKKFLGEAANSPVVKHKTTYFTAISLTYKFS